MSHNELGHEPIPFDELADRLVELGGGSHPSELHGLLCGLLAGGERPGVEAWQRQVAGMLGDEPLDEVSLQHFAVMYESTRSQLERGDFGIQVLLPDDEESMEQRTEALGLWCHGFLSGFGESAANKQLSDDLNGILHDFSEIAQIQESDESDETERFFLEVSEYVRMALLNVFAEMNSDEETAAPVPAAESGRLH
ncbi:UPF0149 family protein [Endozoicomonas euniceicola]|uniref:UPF0149 family protein n=1 Tax=Endozoicomonas euniceicola TaxID=1234143 RepID=A0ABY6GPP4_9GAMM|nr:UPF0149 family protein [Endozoicomonas euniceicola]UYM13969.1 UPF0149 family protein [Endozoicomonas euniceicola]